ncbi:MAG: NAD(P)-dependent oxidoreductase, partial [Bacteriovoracaceae bacterium]
SVRHIHKGYARTRELNFSLNGLVGFDLYKKKIGVVGTGKIGRVFSEICQGFGMHVLAYDPYPASDLAVEYCSFEHLCKHSDIISLHCPLTEESTHLIDRDSIALMKEGVILINTSRGALIDSQALLEGIRTKKIGSAALDVYEEEAELFYEDHSATILSDDVLMLLISMPNVLVTSHQAFLTEEALQQIAKTTMSSVDQYLGDLVMDHEICYRCDECHKVEGKRCF